MWIYLSLDVDFFNEIAVTINAPPNRTVLCNIYVTRLIYET